MSLIKMEMVCPNGHRFESADVSGAYGEFVMRGEVLAVPFFLNALEDSVYSEVKKLLEEMGIFDGMDGRGRAIVLQGVFGLACDRSPDGTILKIGRDAPCPYCGSREMASWRPIGPFGGDQLPVTHVAWSRLSSEQKREVFKFMLTAGA